ncbi:universal stress protein [Haloarculaceae archaeon H-GB2-1]|nr:universal stress protein [Haloarculaceae archaeon H-GB1-1]MEA5386611.1 universal stress protein [Haloarculaceae archaeon H-GB11]MEA5408129.1 universal stress protein [Haloarculaceae archaeon H-GB2-1]
MHFVVAMDGSEQSERALAHAIDVGQPADATISVVYAVDPAVHDEGGDEPNGDVGDVNDRLIIEDVEDEEKRGAEVLEDAATFAAEYGIEVETELLYGNPVEQVADYAESIDADGIFVGHRGLSERAERVLGSTSKGVVERSAVPVTVVR